MDPARLMTRINARHGTSFAFSGRFTGGEGSGASEVRDADGSRWVLKTSDGPGLDFDRAARTTARLRSLGYPAPATRLTGDIEGMRFGITERLTGEPLAELDDDQVERAIELVDLHAGAGLPDPRPWPGWLVGTVVDGDVGFCEHDAMRAHSPATSALLDHLRRVASANDSVDTPMDDIVHFDFTAPNTLAADGVVTGVIDWEGTVTGDRAFDLVTQSLYAYQSARRDRFLDAARARTAPEAIRLYAAHMVLRQVDWTIRHHEPIVAEFFTQLGLDLLDAVGAGPDQPTY